VTSDGAHAKIGVLKRGRRAGNERTGGDDIRAYCPTALTYASERGRNDARLQTGSKHTHRAPRRGLALYRRVFQSLGFYVCKDRDGRTAGAAGAAGRQDRPTTGRAEVHGWPQAWPAWPSRLEAKRKARKGCSGALEDRRAADGGTLPSGHALRVSRWRLMADGLPSLLGLRRLARGPSPVARRPWPVARPHRHSAPTVSRSLLVWHSCAHALWVAARTTFPMRCGLAFAGPQLRDSVVVLAPELSAGAWLLLSPASCELRAAEARPRLMASAIESRCISNHRPIENDNDPRTTVVACAFVGLSPERRRALVIRCLSCS
jgi:hypothetical protein